MTVTTKHRLNVSCLKVAAKLSETQKKLIGIGGIFLKELCPFLIQAFGLSRAVK